MTNFIVCTVHLIASVIKSRRRTGHVVRMEHGSAFKILTGKTTGKRPLGRPRRKWLENVRIDLKYITVNTRNWVVSAKDRDYREPLRMKYRTSGFYKSYR